MIRAIRPSAVARDDASLITGWNIAPNVGYTVTLSASASAVVVILSSLDGVTLIGSGLALVGTDQPITITPVSGQTISMVDVDLGWHLLLTTDGTEGDRAITVDPMVDLADEIHPIYTDDNMALARATAAINAGASYVDDVTVTCPLGIGGGIGAVASAPVDGAALVGQVESVTWSGTPDGTSETAVIRRHTAIAPEAYVPPAPPPMLVDDTAETNAITTTSGNVLANDTGTLTVVAVNGLSVNVGEEVAGSNGGVFVIGPDGSWTFDPAGDFAGLSGSDTTLTSVSYHASNGSAEASATLTMTVSSSVSAPWTPAEITTAQWLDYDDNTTLTWDVGLSVFADKSGNIRNAVMPTSTAQPIESSGLLQFTTSHYMTHNVPQSLPCHIFWVINCSAMGTGARALMNRSTASAPYPPGIYAGGATKYTPDVYWGNGWTGNGCIGAINGGLMILECALTPQFVQFRKNGGTLCGVSHSNTALSSWVETPTSYGPQALAHKMGERIIVNASVDTSVRQKIEGYLAHKWDALLGVTTLVDALPSDHPYKSAPPTV